MNFCGKRGIRRGHRRVCRTGPKTIQIFRPARNPRGMRVVEITTRIVRVNEVPRGQLADFLKTPGQRGQVLPFAFCLLPLLMIEAGCSQWP